MQQRNMLGLLRSLRLSQGPSPKTLKKWDWLFNAEPAPTVVWRKQVKNGICRVSMGRVV
jgi:hypothetical protein